MKTNRCTKFVTMAIGVAALSTGGCAEKEKIADASLPPANDAATTTVTPAAPGPATTAPIATKVIVDVASAKWIDIKDCTYDSRAKFFAGLKALEAKADDEINELTAKRAAMTSTANTKDWDFAMKEMGDARSYLKDMGDELRKTGPDNWDQDKDRVGQAWVRTQNAYDKVKHSTTL